MTVDDTRPTRHLAVRRIGWSEGPFRSGICVHLRSSAVLLLLVGLAFCLAN
jgi:hypothetical protein